MTVSRRRLHVRTAGRIRSVLRRARVLSPGMQVRETAPMIGFGEWRLHTTARHLLDADATTVALSDGEYRLLHVFLTHAQRVLT